MAELGPQIYKNYRLTTAEILYHLPDYPELLQSFIWQEYDLCPKFPVLKNFLDFWTREIDGKLHSVYVASKEIITPSDIGMVDAEFLIHL
jgi:uncharacterized protein Usg